MYVKWGNEIRKNQAVLSNAVGVSAEGAETMPRSTANCQSNIITTIWENGCHLYGVRTMLDVLTPTHNMIEPQKYIHRKLPHSRLLSLGTKQGAISSVIFYFCVEDVGEPIFRTANIIIFSCIEILSLLGWNICVKWWINSLRIFLVCAWLGHQGAV